VAHLLDSKGPDPELGRLGQGIMQKLGYGPDKRLAVTVSSRNIPAYRDPAVILIDQLKEIYIDGVLEPVETANWFPKVMRKDYTVGINGTESGVDDPDQQFYENFVCGAERNYTGYCNPEVDRLIDQQSAEPDVNKRKQLVWEIDEFTDRELVLRRRPERGQLRGRRIAAVRRARTAAPERALTHSSQVPARARTDLRIVRAHGARQA
jgi:ABC-type transport system substrate-binding protein